MKVTLDIYSGVPNPTWELTDAEAAQFLDRYRSQSMATSDGASAPAVLGYRGFLVETSTSEADMPTVIRVGAPTSVSASDSADASSTGSAEDTATGGESWLLQTSKGAVDDELASLVSEHLQAISSGIIRRPICLIQEPAYNPAFWNTPAVQPLNNCYNYASNYRSDTFAQPGRRSGHMYTALTCPAVQAAAISDGVTTVCSGRTKEVALVIWPGRDFHWYAHHPQGFWGHKPGSTPVRNVDNQGRLIGGALNPQNCDRGPYTTFCSYLYSPVGIVVN